MITCHNVFNEWPKTTPLLPMWPRDAKGLDTPARQHSEARTGEREGAVTKEGQSHPYLLRETGAPVNRKPGFSQAVQGGG